MPSYSQRSLNNLNSCDQRLQELFFQIVTSFDCTIIEGHRGEKRQNEMFNTGKSKVRWPDSKHNRSPSLAVDVAPYIAGRGIPWPKKPTDWNNQYERDAYMKDFNEFYYFVGFVMATANSLDISIRSGIDWDRDHDVTDQSFLDAPHFELAL